MEENHDVANVVKYVVPRDCAPFRLIRPTWPHDRNDAYFPIGEVTSNWGPREAGDGAWRLARPRPRVISVLAIVCDGREPRA